jgi:hypothetical protein
MKLLWLRRARDRATYHLMLKNEDGEKDCMLNGSLADFDYTEVLIHFMGAPL